jgi:hypothetical protein
VGDTPVAVISGRASRQRQRGGLLPTEPAPRAEDPMSSLGLVTMPAARTPEAFASFRGGRARDVGMCRLVGQIVDIAAVFPQGHALVVMPAAVLGAHAMRVADEERSHLLLDTEVNDRSRGLVREDRARAARPVGTPCSWRAATSSSVGSASGTRSGAFRAARVACSVAA